MISRQKLIEDIKKESELHSGGLYEDEMLDIIESQPPVDQWIPCSERLPREQGYYLVTYDFGGGEKVVGKSFYSELYDRFTTGVKSAITAWMPLPEPYKGE